jgi:hypothetical protein
MNWKAASIFLCAVALLIAIACSKKRPAAEVVVEIPAGFTGAFLLEMGVKDSPPLEKRGDTYVVAVPGNGKISTSTLLTNLKPTFKNASGGAVWGYSQSVYTTGDGIPTGGKIEFFVGTKKDYDSQVNKQRLHPIRFD